MKQFSPENEINPSLVSPQETQPCTYEDESGLRRQIMPYARSYLYIFTHIKDMINFVNLSRLITNDKSAGESADVEIMSKNIPLSGSLLDLGMVNFVISYDSG
jgi:hypothetical protein